MPKRLGMEVHLLAGRYILGDLLGLGGLGAVYRGRDTQTNTPVAIKLLKAEVIAAVPDVVTRFAREGEMLRSLDHPNIVKVLETVDDPARPAIVMEYVGGGSLAELLRN